MKPVFVGETNPHNMDPAFALYPYSKPSSGYRLATEIMRITPDEYVRRFDRVNLCSQEWSIERARARALEIRTERAAPEDRIILLGMRVCAAFGFLFTAYTWFQQTLPDEGLTNTFVVLPHPSGMCRKWNTPGSYRMGREVLRRSGVLP